MSEPYNPFRERRGGADRDDEIVVRALGGDTAALESLVLRHQSWIYNISVHMCGDPIAAEDVTQEILIKMITKLSTYDPARGAFRTWLYRIAANHVISMARGRRERLFGEFSSTSEERDAIGFRPDTARESPAREAIMDRETRISCVMCILLCLSRRERLVFVLGSIFGVADRVGAEICSVSRANFRQILSRSRRKMFRFFDRYCGLLRESNPCRCAMQTDLMVRAGVIEPGNLQAARESYGRIREVLGETIEAVEDAYYEFTALLRERPFFRGPDMVRWLRDMLNRDAIRLG
ncbi:MAG: RNA polymerase sigma factor [Spirochaetes bacterium]|nr:RNA polymerase sigma factor [Spirochaetota bacterium]